MKHFIWLLPVLLIGCYETGVVYRGVESECLQSSSSGTIVPMRGLYLLESDRRDDGRRRPTPY